MRFKDEIIIAASAEKIFAFYADVDNWPAWDPDTRAAKLHGEFVSGATATLHPAQGPETTITFTDVQQNKSFVAEGKLPLCKLCFEHELFGNVHGIKVVHSVRFQGLLAPLFGLLIGSGLKKSLPHTLQGLKETVESSNE